MVVLLLIEAVVLDLSVALALRAVAGMAIEVGVEKARAENVVVVPMAREEIPLEERGAMEIVANDAILTAHVPTGAVTDLVVALTDVSGAKAPDAPDSTSVESTVSDNPDMHTAPKPRAVTHGHASSGALMSVGLDLVDGLTTALEGIEVLAITVLVDVVSAQRAIDLSGLNGDNHETASRDWKVLI
jgi:hypothetical protein